MKNKLILLFSLFFSGFVFAVNVQISVDAAQHKNLISPWIYGAAFCPQGSYLPSSGITLNRWGGNHSSRYNWKMNAANKDFDWYFHNFSWSHTAEEFISYNSNNNAATIITVPMIPWVAKDANWASVGFSRAKYGDIFSGYDSWSTDAGNGILSSNGEYFWSNDVSDTSIPARAEPASGDPADSVYMCDWIADIGSNSGNENIFYALGNEPELWGDTHRDVFKHEGTFDDATNYFLKYSLMMRSRFPNNKILAPVVSGWWFYWNSLAEHPDKAAHGGTDFLPWFLQTIKNFELTNNVELIDYFTFHYYPTGVFNNNTDAATCARRLRSPRSLWDTNYVDEGWIGSDNWPSNWDQPNRNCIMLLPRMRQLLIDHYRPRPMALTEYNFGANDHISGGLAVADVLGIFGKENLAIASHWTAPETNTSVFAAFQLYRNYDGSNSVFGNISIPAEHDGDVNLFSAYASLKTQDTYNATIILINKDPDQTVTSTVNLINFEVNSSAEVFQFNQSSPNVISRLPNTSGSVFILPPYSASLIEFTAIPEPVGIIWIIIMINCYFKFK